MISVSSQDWEYLLSQIEELIISRINEIRNTPEVMKNQALMKSFDNFHTAFISESIGISLNREEELICLIALLPYIVPGFFDNIVSRIFPQGAELFELGGVKGMNHRGFIPTGETALFLIAGKDVNLRMKAMRHFNSEQILSKHNILHLEMTNEGEPQMSGRLILNTEILEKLLFKGISRPNLSSEFPAKYITTQLTWSNLVINENTKAEVDTIRNWIAHHDVMAEEWELKHKFKTGYKALFYGPPGTGKTFTATLLGKQFNKDVYRIDLAQIVSKYIGETEKNLEKIFQKAENKNWILFFDEADALFGKRTSVSSAHDRYANQETSYLLQRIEDFTGLVILASNNKSNIDPAFLRRFNAIVHFPLPDPEERLHLWKIYLPANHGLAKDELVNIAGKYEVTGSTILNAIHNSAINAFASKTLIEKDSIIESLKRELRKEDRMMN
jgi:AAA+ superfamily predicted ATPase